MNMLHKQAVKQSKYAYKCGSKSGCEGNVKKSAAGNAFHTRSTVFRRLTDTVCLKKQFAIITVTLQPLNMTIINLTRAFHSADIFELQSEYH